MRAGRLIVFEGAEGAGKSTQIRLLLERLKGEEIPCVAFREPGGTAVGDAIREMLLDPAREITPATESLLFMASRAELIAREVRPAIAEGLVVILDRFFLSTYAYQIAGRGLPEADVRAANHLATGGVVPDITLLLDIPANEGLDRAAKRGGRDRMERTGGGFHERINQAFALFSGSEWQRAHPECGRIVRINGAASEAEVAAEIEHALSDILQTG
jgi:dTMP kinase